jgi:hypothetical protein
MAQLLRSKIEDEDEDDQEAEEKKTGKKSDL